MAQLPSGTVTFLFTDIEGSTRLLKQLGDGYADLLAEHQRILRDAFAAHDGHEIDTQGDSFFIAFRRARDAVAAAVEAQRALIAHEWPENAQCKVRMGLHSGEPVAGEQRYTGLDVHRAARIAAAGHGGQVLVSDTTRSLVEDDLPPGVKLRDLGRVELKDLDRPEHISQLVVDGLPSAFPRLKTHGKPPLYRRRNLLAGAVAGVVAAAIAIPIFALGAGGSNTGISVDGNAVAVIDPHSNRVTAQIPVGARPDAISYGAGSLWVANLDDQTVSRIDPTQRQVTRSFTVSGTPTGVAATTGAVWVVNANGGEPYVGVQKIDPQFGSVGTATHLGNVNPGGPGSVAAGADGVWVAPSSGLLTRLNPQTGKPKNTVDPQSGPSSVAVGDGAVWITDEDGNSVTNVDSTGLVTPIPVGNGPSAVAVDASGVWIAETLDDAVARIDPTTHAVTATIPVGGSPTGVALGDGSVWAANSRDGTVTRIDEATGKPLRTIDVGGSPQGITFANGQVWVTVDQATLTQAPAGAGGTLHLTQENDFDFLDPALAFAPQSWQVLNATCVKLVNYPDKPAPAGSQLEPEAAKSLPAIFDHGTAYTFTIRRGFRFSPPSNEPVTAQTFKFSIERSLSPKMKSSAAQYMRDLVGFDAYEAGKAPHISGIAVRGDKLTFRLVKSQPDFVSRLALMFFCAVPTNTPLDPNGVRAVPGAGPYYVSSYTPGQGAVLVRNPNYHGNRPHHVDRIVISIGLKTKTADAQIEAGKLDYGLSGVDLTDRARLLARFGPRSAGARKGEQRFFISFSPNVSSLLLNTTHGIFKNVRLRRAVSLAVDRAALAEIGIFGNLVPGDGYLPPGIPGHTGQRLFPLHGDLAAARRLAGSVRRAAVMYTCDLPACARTAQILKGDLARIGITVDVRAFSFGTMFAREARPGEPFDIGLAGWAADYLDPSDFLNYAIATPGIAGPGFSDPPWGSRLAAAARLSGPPRYLAYGRLATQLARQSSPWVTFGYATTDNFFSARVGCQIVQPATGIDLAALCLKK